MPSDGPGDQTLIKAILTQDKLQPTLVSIPTNGAGTDGKARSVVSGRLSRLRRREAVKASKWPISRAPPSASDRPGLGDVDGRAAERPPDGIELHRRGAPTCCGRRHRPGSNSHRRWFTRWLAHDGYGAATSPAHYARNDITSLRFPLHRYGIRRLSALLGRAGRRDSSTSGGLAGGRFDGGLYSMVWLCYLARSSFLWL